MTQDSSNGYLFFEEDMQRMIYGKRYEWLESLFPAELSVRFYQHKRKEGNYGK